MASDVTIMFMTLLPNLERLFEYLPVSGQLPAEAPRFMAGDGDLKASGWPPNGSIEMDQVNMRYVEGQELRLKSMSMSIKSGEKIGIVGRTGAGKSTLLTVLFRLVEPCGGKIWIDGQEISSVGLATLRQSLAMIPQEAVLIEGTAGENMDPFGNHERRELETVLDRVGLSPSLVDHQVGTAGELLSVGERQLLALARILLRREVKIVVMDEPTANIDPDTDQKIQSVIREEFSTSTILTIAHRLHTIADFDKVLTTVYR